MPRRRRGEGHRPAARSVRLVVDGQLRRDHVAEEPQVHCGGQPVQRRLDAWTLPSNLALCVHAELRYVKFRDEHGDVYICGKGFQATVLVEFSGAVLVGTCYRPLFAYFADRKHCFRAISDAYVTDDDGTGNVHRKGEEEVLCPIDHNGCARRPPVECSDPTWYVNCLPNAL